MAEDEITNFSETLFQAKKDHPLVFLNSLYEVDTRKRSAPSLEQAQVFFEGLNSKSPLPPSFKLINRDKLILTFLKQALGTDDFKVMMGSKEMANFLSPHINTTTLIHYDFLNSFISDEIIFEAIFRPAFQVEQTFDFTSKEVSRIFERMIPLWTESSENLITDKQIENIIKWYNVQNDDDSKASLSKLDVVNKIFEKNFSSFENNNSSQYRENVMNRQILLNMKSKIKKDDQIDLKKLSFSTVLTILEKTESGEALTILKTKKEELLEKLKSNNTEDNYHGSLIELQYAKMNLFYNQTQSKEIKLYLINTLKKKWIEAYQAYTNDFSPMSWDNLKTKDVFEGEKPVLDSENQIIDLSCRAEELNKRLLSPGVFKSDRNLILKAENLYFHPLTMILANEKNVEINAKNIYGAFIDTSGIDGKINQTNCAKYTNTSLPTQKQWGDGGDFNRFLGIPDCKNYGHNKWYSISDYKTFNFSIGLDDKSLFEFLNNPTLELNGSDATSAGNITINANYLSSPQFFASGGSGAHGNDGCDSKTFLDQSYSQTFKRGELDVRQVILRYPRNNDDRDDGVDQNAGLCQDPSYSQETLSLHRVEAGSGGKAGDGGRITIQTKNSLLAENHFTFISSSGVKGLKGKDAKGPAQERRPPTNGGKGANGTTILNGVPLVLTNSGILKMQRGEQIIETVNIAKSVELSLLNPGTGIEQRQLEILGAGLRIKKLNPMNKVKLYVTQIFSEDASTFERTSPSEALTSLTKIKLAIIHLTFLQGTDSQELKRSFEVALLENGVDVKREDIANFLTAIDDGRYYQYNKSTMAIVLSKLEDGKVKVVCLNKNGEEKTIIGDSQLFTNIFSIWLGTPTDPGMENLRTSLIKGVGV